MLLQNNDVSFNEGYKLSFLKIIDRLSSAESICSMYVLVTMHVSESSFLM